MAAKADRVVEREVYIEATPETVFGYLVEPAKMTRWMGTEAVFEARPGGRYRVNVSGRDIAVGEVIEVSPHRRVVFSWGWEGGGVLPPGASRVEITLRPTGTGTTVKLRHSGLPGELADRHAEGWEHYMARLGIAAAGGDAGADPWVKDKAAE